MEVSKTKLEGILLIKPPTIFKDFRGSYVETYNEKLYKEAGIDIDFIQETSQYPRSTFSAVYTATM